MANSKNKLRLGLIGCGRVTETLHLPALQPLGGAEVVALSDISVDRLNKVADFFHIKDRYTDYQQLLKDQAIDVVAVCVPAEFHVEVALSALEAGKHVFVEKPLALELAEAKAEAEVKGIRSSWFENLSLSLNLNRIGQGTPTCSALT